MNIDSLIKGLEKLKEQIGDELIYQIEILEDDTGVEVRPAFMHGAFLLREGEDGTVIVEEN